MSSFNSEVEIYRGLKQILLSKQKPANILYAPSSQIPILNSIRGCFIQRKFQMYEWVIYPMFLSVLWFRTHTPIESHTCVYIMAFLKSRLTLSFVCRGFFFFSPESCSIHGIYHHYLPWCLKSEKSKTYGYSNYMIIYNIVSGGEMHSKFNGCIFSAHYKVIPMRDSVCNHTQKVNLYIRAIVLFLPAIPEWWIFPFSEIS